jgi:hypothetical protein
MYLTGLMSIQYFSASFIEFRFGIDCICQTKSVDIYLDCWYLISFILATCNNRYNVERPLQTTEYWTVHI